MKVTGPKREEVAGGWRRLHNEGLYNLYASPDVTGVIKLRMMRWVEYVECMGEMRNVYKSLIRKPKEKRPFRRPKHRWEDNIRTDLR
jgi:hypothetical protein